MNTITTMRLREFKGQTYGYDQSAAHGGLVDVFPVKFVGTEYSQDWQWHTTGPSENVVENVWIRNTTGVGDGPVHVRENIVIGLRRVSKVSGDPENGYGRRNALQVVSYSGDRVTGCFWEYPDLPANYAAGRRYMASLMLGFGRYSNIKIRPYLDMSSRQPLGELS